MTKQGVLVVGSANMDMVVQASHFPSPGETILGGDFGMYPGGKGANQAVASAKLGAETYFIGKMGRDIFKDQLCESMKRDGVNLDHLFLDESTPTGIALITVDLTGENEIVVVSGSNMKLTAEELENKGEVIKSVKVVLTQLEIPLPTVQKAALMAKENSAIFILNPAPAREIPNSILSLCDYLTPNETELEILTGISVNSIDDAITASRKLLECGVKNVIVTLGSQGALLVNQNNNRLFPAKVVKVVDSTGAGDAFNGALAYSLASAKTIDDAMKFAINVASFSVTRNGAQSSMPKLEEIIKM